MIEIEQIQHQRRRVEQALSETLRFAQIVFDALAFGDIGGDREN